MACSADVHFRRKAPPDGHPEAAVIAPTSVRQAGPLEEVDADHDCCADDECGDTVSADPLPSPSCRRRRPHAMVARSIINELLKEQGGCLAPAHLIRVDRPLKLAIRTKGVTPLDARLQPCYASSQHAICLLADTLLSVKSGGCACGTFLRLFGTTRGRVRPGESAAADVGKQPTPAAAGDSAVISRSSDLFEYKQSLAGYGCAGCGRLRLAFGFLTNRQHQRAMLKGWSAHSNDRRKAPPRSPENPARIS